MIEILRILRLSTKDVETKINDLSLSHSLSRGLNNFFTGLAVTTEFCRGDTNVSGVNRGDTNVSGLYPGRPRPGSDEGCLVIRLIILFFHSSGLSIIFHIHFSIIDQEFCVKDETAAKKNDFDIIWPDGQYCIFKYGLHCPLGLKEGKGPYLYYVTHILGKNDPYPPPVTPP